jgi:hypothetical protein
LFDVAFWPRVGEEAIALRFHERVSLRSDKALGVPNANYSTLAVRFCEREPAIAPVKRPIYEALPPAWLRETSQASP